MSSSTGKILDIIWTVLKNGEFHPSFPGCCDMLVIDLMSLCPPTYDPPGGPSTYDLPCARLWLRSYRNFYERMISSCPGLIFPSRSIRGNECEVEVHMQLDDMESKVLCLFDKLGFSNRPNCLTQDADIVIQRVNHQIVAGRQKLEAGFNSYKESIRSIRIRDPIQTSRLQTSDLRLLDLKSREGHRAAFNSDIQSVTTPLNPASHRRPPHVVDEAYALSEINATSSHSRYSHNFVTPSQNITQWHLGWHAWTIQAGVSVGGSLTDPIVSSRQEHRAAFNSDIQLATRISSDSLTDPIVASREEHRAAFNSDIESLTTPSNPETTDANALFNRPSFIETSLAITSQIALGMLTVGTSGSTSFSQNQKILFSSAAAFNLIGFLYFLFAILVLGKKPRIAKFVTRTGFICIAYGFIAIMGMLLKDNIMLWVTGLAGVALFSLFAFAFTGLSTDS